jgi:hypothetical protein
MNKPGWDGSTAPIAHPPPPRDGSRGRRTSSTSATDVNPHASAELDLLSHVPTAALVPTPPKGPRPTDRRPQVVQAVPTRNSPVNFSLAEGLSGILS